MDTDTLPVPALPGGSPVAVEHEKIDSLEARMLLSGLPAVDLPLKHHFYSSGLYGREIFMPAGTLLTSKIHITEHPYVVLKGVAWVYIPGVGAERIEAPFFGTTKPHTRRVLYIEEDCTWVTFHPLVEGEAGIEDLPMIENRIIEKHLLPDGTEAFEEYQNLLEEAKVALGLAEGTE